MTLMVEGGTHRAEFSVTPNKVKYGIVPKGASYEKYEYVMVSQGD
jgi:hypothetical protein